MVSAMESMGGVRLSPYCWLHGAVEGEGQIDKTAKCVFIFSQLPPRKENVARPPCLAAHTTPTGDIEANDDSHLHQHHLSASSQSATVHTVLRLPIRPRHHHHQQPNYSTPNTTRPQCSDRYRITASMDTTTFETRWFNSTRAHRHPIHHNHRPNNRDREDRRDSDTRQTKLLPPHRPPPHNNRHDARTDLAAKRCAVGWHSF